MTRRGPVPVFLANGTLGDALMGDGLRDLKVDRGEGAKLRGPAHRGPRDIFPNEIGPTQSGASPSVRVTAYPLEFPPGVSKVADTGSDKVVAGPAGVCRRNVQVAKIFHQTLAV